MKSDLENRAQFAGSLLRRLRSVWPRRLSAQLVLLFSLMLAASMTFFTYLMLREVNENITSNMKLQAGVLAKDISAAGANLLLQRDYTSIEQMLLRSINFPGVVAIQVCDPQGKLIGDVTRRAGESPEVHYGETPLHVPVDAAPSVEYEKTRMLVWQPVMLGDLLGWVKITYNLQDILDAQQRLWHTVAINGAAIILLALVFLGGLIRRPLLSVERYTEFAGNLVEMHGSKIPVDQFSIELERLGEALNDASVRLEEQGRAVKDSMAELEKLAAFPENNPNIVLSMDADANITYINPHGMQMLAELQLEPVDIGKLLPNDYRMIVRRCLSDGLAPPAVEVEFSRRILLWTFAPLVTQHIVHCYAQEITENKRAQQYAIDALIEKQAAEAASQAKSTFLANMSHEIRTPLSGVMGFLDLLSKTRLTKIQRDYLKTTEVSAKMLLNVINDTLDFSKIEAGKISIERIEFELKELLEGVVSLHAPNAENRGLDLTFVFNQDVPNRLIGDPSRISQVLSNLLGNAIKFTHNGKIHVQVDLKDESDADALIEVSVKDSGIGISAEEQQRLFLPFSQADASITRKYGGTGLGLVISKTLVELMGGEISVESHAGQGARFAFTLRLPKQKIPHFRPAHEQIVVAQKPGSFKLRSKEAGVKLSVLIVDDNEINRKLAKILVEQLGASSDLADNGAQAIDACIRKAYDLILMDIHMPVMDGVEATTRIRELEKDNRHHTLIIALTANALSSDKERYLAAGMDEYLSKPINETAFVNLLKKLGLIVEATVSRSKPDEREKKSKVDGESGIEELKSLPMLDPQLGVELSFGNRETWRTVLNMLLDSLTEYSASLTSAKDDPDKLSQVAHKLAGASSYCGTPALNHQAGKLENLAKKGDMGIVKNALDELLRQIERLLSLRDNGSLPDAEGPIY